MSSYAFNVRRQSHRFFGSRCAFSPLVNLMREQVKSLSSIGLSVVSLSDLKKVEAEKVLGKAAHSVVFDKRQLEICLRSHSEMETFFSDANVSNVYRKGCELQGKLILWRGHELYLSAKGANKFGFSVSQKRSRLRG